MAEQRKYHVSDSERAQAFLEFFYPEIKDLATKFLTLIAAVLTVSVTFSEKIVDFGTASWSLRAIMMFAWGACLAAVTLGGLAVYEIYIAGALAKHTTLYGENRPFWKVAMFTNACLLIGGVLFVLALGAMVLVGMLRIWK